MSQVAVIDFESNNPQIPTSFVTNSGIAIPVANVLNVLGAVVAAGTNPFRTIGSGNTVTAQVQIASAVAATDATRIGLAAFNSANFTVDANGFVSASATTPLSFPTDSGTGIPSSNLFRLRGQSGVYAGSGGIQVTSPGNNNSDFRLFSPYTLDDFTFSNTALSTKRTLQVQNSGADALSDARILINTTGSSTSDAYLQVGQGATNIFCWGTDNSDGNTLKICQNGNSNTATPSGGTLLWKMTTAGAASYVAGNVDITRSGGGAPVSLTVQNNGNASGSDHALVQHSVGGTGGGDPLTTYVIPAGSTWSTGVDNSVSGDPYVIAASTALGTSNAISIDTSGNMTVTGLIAPEGISLNSGSAVIRSVKRTITNAEIKALNTTPIQLIAAPAAGSAITILSFTARFNYGGNNPFIGGGSLQLRATNGTGQNIAALNLAIYTGTVDKLYATNAAVSVAPFGTMEAQPVVLFIATSDPTGNAANDNTLDVLVNYQVVTF